MRGGQVCVCEDAEDTCKKIKHRLESRRASSCAVRAEEAGYTAEAAAAAVVRAWLIRRRTRPCPRTQSAGLRRSCSCGPCRDPWPYTWGRTTGDGPTRMRSDWQSAAVPRYNCPCLAETGAQVSHSLAHSPRFVAGGWPGATAAAEPWPDSRTAAYSGRDRATGEMPPNRTHPRR